MEKNLGYLWKIIGVIIVLITLVGTLIGITKDWNIILNGLSSIGNFFLEILKYLISPIGRDVLLFLLIVGTLFWVFLINKKPSQTYKIKPKKEKKKPVLTEEQFFILVMIAESMDMMNVSSILNVYRKRFPDALRVDVRSIINWLEKNGLIWDSSIIGSGSDFCYTATDKGVEYVSEILKNNKKQ